MAHRRTALIVFLPAAVALATLVWMPRLLAQALRMGMYVSVVDRDGAPVPDIRPADLVIREDNVSREILRIDPATDPMQVAILIDDSEASRDAIPDMRQALPALVDALLAPSGATGPGNEVALIAVADRPTILTDYTRDRAKLQKGMGLVWSQSGSGSYLLDALVEVSQGFKKRGAGRPVIIAVTTEGPELSARYQDQVLIPLRESGAAFYAFTVGPPASEMRGRDRDRAIVLDEGTRTTGGHRESVLASSGLTMRLKLVANELTHQYRVTYARPQTLIPPEQVTVSTPRPGLTARGTLIRDQQGRQ